MGNSVSGIEPGQRPLNGPQTSGRDYRNLSKPQCDLVEWTAKQPWSDGNVGMIGISYFAMTQMEAAVERSPHLKAIMPVAGTFDLLPLRYRIPMVANARRFRTGHRVRLFLTSDDQDPHTPALLTFRHASVGTSSLNTVRSSSRLVLPVVSGLGRK